MKKLKLIGVFTFFGLCITFLLTSWDPIPEEIPEVFEQHPPIPTEYWAVSYTHLPLPTKA